MPIEFSCSCGKSYRVADSYAGKRIRCKNCGGVVSVPAANAGANSSLTANEHWYVHSHDGNQYGPVTRQQLDGWVAGGSITSNCRLARAGESSWRSAVDVYPQLATSATAGSPPAAAPPTTASPAAVNPAAVNPGVGGAAAGQSGAIASGDYAPLLKATGKTKTMGNLAMRGEIKQVAGLQLLSSNVYQVGEAKTFAERLKAGTIIGPIKFSEMQIDLLQLFHFRDAAGELAVVVPFDNGMIAPIEFVARMPGSLPSAIALLKQSGGKVALEAGAVVGGPVGALLQHVGTSVESVWVGCDGGVPSVAQAAQNAAELRKGIRWEGKIGGGPVSTIYRLSWGVQAIPVSSREFLLVAQGVPKQKMLGLDFGLPWFCDYRRKFSQFAAGINGSAGPVDFLDPGVWLPASVEVLQWLRL